ncbi:MAG TPA: glycosyltransferase family 4 protein [Blastocatellia bacterium]|nr:glycosyltransferase family 4 protein [Blastocatellia bacterium]
MPGARDVNPKIVLSTPAINPFAQQVGRAFFEAEMLARLATSFVDRPEVRWRKTLCRLAGYARINLERQLRRRSITEVPLSLVADYPLREAIRVGVGRLGVDKRLLDVVFHWGNDGFDKWVANQMLGGSRAVYGYEYACLATFQSASQKGMARIYDVPAPEHDFVHAILDKEVEGYPELHTPYQKYIKARHAARTERRRKEWQLADLVIANSEFTKASYASSGLDVSKVRVVPYGAPPVSHEGLDGGGSENEPLRFLWAGTFSVRKGAHHLLEAWRQLRADRHARLDVFGAMQLPDSLREGVSDSITFSGTVPHAELYALYRRADVLVFPTLCDGFGLVVTEAFSQGLPVITTNRAGAADLVRHGVNGLIVPAGDVEALREALDWCLTHRKEVRAMRQAALDAAAGWQWADYRRALVDNVVTGLSAAGSQACQSVKSA